MESEITAVDLESIYLEDSLIGNLLHAINHTPRNGGRVQIKGLSGSLDSLVVALSNQQSDTTHLIVLHDREEASYFRYDLENLIPGKEIILFPLSYRRPYQFEETDNANVVMRSEALDRISQNTGEIIVTYPEALSEKVISKQSLMNFTLAVKRGQQISMQELTEKLIEFDFDRVDFTYEAGQYSVRGGIMDIFTYASEFPFRLEFMDDQIESIRTFDPANQLSIDTIEEARLVPDVHERITKDTSQSFIDFLPEDTLLWFRDFQFVHDKMGEYFGKVEDNFSAILEKSANTQVISSPDQLFETQESFAGQIKSRAVIEFGSRFYLDSDSQFEIRSEPQPSFNQNFDLLGDNLHQYRLKGYHCLIGVDSPGQTERLTTIFEELNPEIRFQCIQMSLREGFVDHNTKVVCYTDHQIFERFHRYHTKEKYSRSKAITIKELNSLQPGDFVTHIDYGIGRFAGLEKIDVAGRNQEAIRLVYKDNDLLYISIHSLHKIARYTGKEGVPPSISKLGSPEWENKKKRVRKNVRNIASDLIALYAKRKATNGITFSPDNYLQAELESSFIYEDTPDQSTATMDVKEDMEASFPMDRLICGDVGFGKTEVAIRAAFKCINESKQVAVLVPTTILASQHFRTFSQRLKNFPVTVDYINRFRSTKQTREILEKTEDGKIDILIGTHRIVNKDMKFKDLGLLIIDEEQKFGVKVKERLKQLKLNVDVLTLSATPIPRTLHFSLMGARDLSIISTPPPNRQPVTTEIHHFNEEVIRDAISYEMNRGGQIFFVHNRISDIEEIGNIILRLVPEARLTVAHGQMKGDRLENNMLKFIDGEYDVLLSTNIIESGLDIPNANTIIINQAHMFGLSDLHQMRGRVGRSNRKAFCFLLSPPTLVLTADARKRLQTLEDFTELGDGFKVAMRDLDIRGAGNLLGAEQSGFISDIGFETYHKILDETIAELKDTEFKSLFASQPLVDAAKKVVSDCVIETDLELIIPEDYVVNTSERLSLYAGLDNIKKETELELFKVSLQDRFGPVPESVDELIESVRLRWQAEELGFEKLVLKNTQMKCHFLPSHKEEYYKSEVFGRILKYVQAHPELCKMREHRQKLTLTVKNVPSVYKGLELLSSI